MKKIITLCALMLASLPSWSFTPESGLYWDPNQPGTGFNIEIQDNFLFAVFYVYDEFGYPIWYTTSGFLDGNSYFEGDILISEDGQCFGCQWQQNNSYVTDFGQVQIDFITETQANVSYLGQTQNLERFNFFLGDELQKMRGEWQVVYDVSEYTNNYPFYADVLIFEQTETFNGDYLATGCRSESTTYNRCTNYALNNNDMAASYDTVNDELIVVVRDDADYYLAYYLKTGTNQFDGEAFSYLVGNSPNLSQAGFTVRGFRSASKHFVDTGTGPSKALVQSDRVASGLGQIFDSSKTAQAKPSRLDAEQQQRVLNTIKTLETQLK